MIEEIEVDGFRSLSQFKLTLQPGLNILIGPNGSGKSNIIHFFEFLTNLCIHPLSEAINASGGAGSVFQKLETGQFVDQIVITIRGLAPTREFERPHRFARYEYRCTIAFSNANDVVYFRNQTASITSSKQKDHQLKKWDVTISSEISLEERFRFSTHVDRIDLRKTTEPSFIQTSLRRRQDKIKGIEEFLKAFCGPEQMLFFAMPRLMREARDILPDFLGGMSLNVIPSIAKLYEDSAKPPGVRRDGSGLAPTLYALLKRATVSAIGRQPPIRRYIPSQLPGRIQRTFRHSRDAFEKIRQYVHLVNQEILNIEVEKDHDDNLLKIFIILRGEKESLRLPFSLMSDGTIKWIALVTAIFTNDNMFAIEEPENFIHPLMQQEILKLMRDVHIGQRRGSFVLMTTHSETLLNAAAPEEVVVVSMDRGKTRARRPKQTDEIREEINQSGFGLGYMYLSGILNDA